MRNFQRLLVVCIVALMCQLAFAEETKHHEQNCSDGIDNDNDGLTDCSDADCFSHASCQADGEPENTNERCHDYIDNDNDGAIDCDDMECDSAQITVCKGSFDLVSQEEVHDAPTHAPSAFDGERNDMLCSDGVDNDGDGKIDCQDEGCHGPDVAVCQNSNSFRLSAYAGIVPAEYNFSLNQFTTYIARLQLRAMGQIPRVQNSFFLLSARLEKAPRLSFALFQIPIFQRLYLSLNTGGGNLSNLQILSVSKQLLIEPPYDLYAPFEQIGAVAVEVGGYLTEDNRLSFRTFASGGTGLFTGNIGGRSIRRDTERYSFSTGAQLGINAIGYYSRWDSPFLYEEAPTALAFFIGGKYERRAFEQFPAVSGQMFWRWQRLVFLYDGYVKRELDYKSWQWTYDVQLGVLLWPRHLFWAAEWGEYWSSMSAIQPQQRAVHSLKQLRTGLHWYFWRNNGVASLLYAWGNTDKDKTLEGAEEKTQRLLLEIQIGL